MDTDSPIDTDNGMLPDTPDTMGAAPAGPEVAVVAAEAGAAEAEVDADAAVMDLLSEKVPLSLLIDLSSPAGPDSEQILDDEGEPESPWWEAGS